MTPTMLAILLRPLLSFVFLAVVVAPIVWLLHKMIPNSRLKVAMISDFRPHASP
jgi:hypothetical protein